MTPTARHILIATCRSLGLIITITVLIFVMVRTIPGDVVDVLSAEGGLTDEMKQEMRDELGLTASWSDQFFGWTSRALTGDFGVSLRFHKPIDEIVLGALPVTLQLALMSFFFGLTLAVGVATSALIWPRSFCPKLIQALNIWSIALPTFCVGFVGILIFVLWLRWMPLLGNMVLPVIVIGLDVAGQIAKPLYEDLKETQSAAFVRTARAKGLGWHYIAFVHVLPNSMSIVLALSGLILADLIGGAIAMEVLFGLPGIGKLALDSVLGRDYPLIQAVILILAISVILINFATEIAARVIDPRQSR